MALSYTSHCIICISREHILNSQVVRQDLEVKSRGQFNVKPRSGNSCNDADAKLCSTGWLVVLFYSVSTPFMSFNAELNFKQFRLE